MPFNTKIQNRFKKFINIIFITVGAMNMREYRIKNSDKSKPKCKNKCKPNSKVYIDNKNNKHNLEIITNKKDLEINKKEYQDIIDYLIIRHIPILY